jgi:peptidoglycan-associated lipoprotein
MGDGSGGANGSGGMGHNGPAKPGTQEDLVVNVGDRVFFAYNESDLSSEARATLDRQAAWLKKYGTVNITVEGHCDERGTREYNLALGERRATAVKNYLVADGIGAGRVKTISYGKERPAVVGSNEAAWAQNRRGVTVVQ